ncbi:hypothetical protein B0H14DRAFT_2991000 [Mycena olivaceomarginata]|nr:hypothetical protein B0H14DRAFT_2991000 [Mycena olivaceomarginata]
MRVGHCLLHKTLHRPGHHMCVSHCLSETPHWPRHHMCVSHCLETLHRPKHHMRVGHCLLRWHAIFSKTPHWPGHHMRVSQSSLRHMCVSHPVALQGFKSVNILILTLTLLSGLWIICPLMNSHLSIIHTFHLFLRLCCLYACSSGRRHCTLCFQFRAQGCS